MAEGRVFNEEESEEIGRAMGTVTAVLERFMNGDIIFSPEEKKIIDEALATMKKFCFTSDEMEDLFQIAYGEGELQ